MTDQSAAAPGTAPSPAARLEPDAIGVAQDTVIGMASSAPAATVGLSLFALVAAHRLRQRADPDPDRDPDAHHRELLPAAEPVERQLRRLL